MASAAHMATTTLRVDGMTCGACTSSVESGFKDVDGAGNVSVSLIMGRAVVQHDPKTLSPDSVKNIIEDRGFDAEILSTDNPFPTRVEGGENLMIEFDETQKSKESSLFTTTLAIEGMTCGA